MIFSFFRSFYRRLYICVLLYFHSFVEFVSSIDDKRNSTECKPILTNDELLNYSSTPITWQHFVEPLTRRCSPRILGEKFQVLNKCAQPAEVDETTRPKVMLLHDMAGNYHGDRFISGSNKWDDYRFYHWSGIDYFCYFSHNYITIPPLTWINAAHRNGVPILGTFIVEHEDGQKLLREVLQSEVTINQTVEALVFVTKTYGFDGWLLNVECSVKPEQVTMLRKFVRRVTQRMHEDIVDGKVFWYDSVIDTGSLSWQNEVNEANIDMYSDTDGILLNYGWNESNLKRTADILKNDPEAMSKVYVGIDVFGRNQVAKFHTRDTLQKIKAFNFSIGIFAPAWTFEATEDLGLDPFASTGSDVFNQHFIQRNNLFWMLLWKYLYTSGPKQLPFYTSFCLGSGKRKFRDGLLIQNEPWFNLLEQEYQPSVPSVFKFQFEDAFRGGSCIKFVGSVNNVRLFASDFSCDNNITVSYVFKRTDPRIQTQLVLNIVDANGQGNLLAMCNDTDKGANVDEAPGKLYLNPLTSTALRPVIIGLSERQEKLFPSSSSRPINGWETRYFYLKFADKAKQSRIVDIGITVIKTDWTAHDSVLLGGVHIHAGVSNDDSIPATDVEVNSSKFARDSVSI